ncbi:MAG: electron transfer flavoprotein subunit alpha/FixB family protein [Planctomycetota bacterium]|jgi:electron transfer flavoprotein alpha subunit
MNNKGLWILAEQVEGTIQTVSFELLTRAKKLADKLSAELSVVIFGYNLSSEALNELIERGADKVYAVEDAQLQHFVLEPYSASMVKLVEKYKPEIIIAAATSMGRTLMPYVAVKTHAGLTADCTMLNIEEKTGNLLQTRPAIGGNILATIKTPNHRPQMATVRPHSTKPAPRQKGRRGEIVRLKPDECQLHSRIKRLDFVPYEAEHTIQDANIIVSVGRGIKKGENISTVEPLVKKLGAALGATRDVVDRGWLSYSHQVGLSGKTVNPKLYFAIGISGAIQHLAGMQTSKTIVAINNDPDAPIFRLADFGIVGDIFEVVPALCERLEGNRSND